MTKDIAIGTMENLLSKIDSLTESTAPIWLSSVIDHTKTFIGDDTELYDRLRGFRFKKPPKTIYKPNSYFGTTPREIIYGFDENNEKEQAKHIITAIIEYIKVHGIIEPKQPTQPQSPFQNVITLNQTNANEAIAIVKEEPSPNKNDNLNDNFPGKVGRTIWDFIKENPISSIATLILVLVMFGYFITHQWGIRISGIELTPPKTINEEPLKINSTNGIITENNPKIDTLDKAPIELIAWYRKIDNDYQAQQLAKKLYYGKLIKYEGVIEDIKAEDAFNEIIFYLPNVIAQFDENSEAVSFNKGEKITFIGKVINISQDWVQVDSCNLTRKPQQKNAK